MKDTDLTNRQRQTATSNIARKVAGYVNRLDQYVMGKPDSNGNIPELSNGQVKVMLHLIDKIVSSPTSMTWQDLTPEQPAKQDIESAYQAALEAIGSQQLAGLLNAMPADERAALVQSLEAEKH